jgi:transposase
VPEKIPMPPRDELKAKYDSGMSTFDLAEEYDVGQKTAYNWLVEYDIDRRRVGRPGVTKADCLSHIEDWVEEHGEVPSQYDLKEVEEAPTIPTYRNKFGSWTEAVKEAGYEPQTDNRDK